MIGDLVFLAETKLLKLHTFAIKVLLLLPTLEQSI
jgi:hypothetical protein